MSSHPLTAVLTVSLILQQNGKVLILKERKDDGVEKMMLPGGHIDLGEVTLEAAQREAMEETGFKVEVGPLVQIVVRTLKNGTHAVRQTYVANIIDGELKTEQGVDASWLTPEEIISCPEESFNFGSRAALLLAFESKAIDPSKVIIQS